ncbi:MAG: hypothetical protein PHC61_03780 [Chitinivibrionales bacterium]|nr:hypothetical protein [Chitinivibrionales bacterium]
MRRKISLIAAIIVLATSLVSAEFAAVKVSGGLCKIKPAAASDWAAVSDSADLAFGDSLQADDSARVTILFSKDNLLLLRGGSRIFFGGEDSNAVVALERGQLFLEREAPYAFKTFMVQARGCKFIPLGTAAAVRVNTNGEASVAVVRGRMQMEGPSGEPAVIETGFFGTFDNNSGAIRTDRLSPKALANLAEWSGVPVESGATPVVAAANAPAAVTGAPGAAPATSTATVSKPADTSAGKPAPTSGAPAQSTPGTTTQSTPAAAATVAGGVAPATENQPTPGGANGASAEKGGAEGGKPEKGTPGGGIAWQIGVGNVTVDGRQWTRLVLSPDIPIWKFGICLDLEFFIDPDGNFSNKGWDFKKDAWQESLTRKVRYIRFGHETEPLFAKVGGLDNVTLSYGFIMDRFTNMLHYPDQKLLGVQLYLNNIGPLGMTLQTATPDVMEFKDKGGIVAVRGGIMPLKMLKLPLLSNLTIGATYATDLNQYAPARAWQNPPLDTAYWRKKGADSTFLNEYVRLSKQGSDTVYRDSTSPYALLGADAELPIVKTPFFGLDVYAQAGVVADSNFPSGSFTGWGIGMPGVAVNVGPLLARVEYRHIRGEFTPGYFNAYYLDERLMRYPNPLTKSSGLSDKTLDGIFGTVGMNIVNIFMIDGTYQYMTGALNALDQRFEARGGIGDVVLSKIPKIKKVEAFFEKTNINRDTVYDSKGQVQYTSNGKIKYDGFFDKTQHLYYGYRLGVELAKGATLLWQSRFGFEYNTAFNLVPNNNVSIETVISF